jgi:uncharacterized membrane protein
VDRKKWSVASHQLSVASKSGPLRPSVCAIVPAVFGLIAVATPFFRHSIPILGFALQRGFALVCHQRPDRSFVMFGGSVAVCARCLGIYLGAAVGLLLRVPRGVASRRLIAAVAINMVDWLAEIAGIHGNWMLARFLLGITLGATAAMLIIASIEKVKIPIQAKAT